MGEQLRAHGGFFSTSGGHAGHPPKFAVALGGRRRRAFEAVVEAGQVGPVAQALTEMRQVKMGSSD